MVVPFIRGFWLKREGQSRCRVVYMPRMLMLVLGFACLLGPIGPSFMLYFAGTFDVSCTRDTKKQVQCQVRKTGFMWLMALPEEKIVQVKRAVLRKQRTSLDDCERANRLFIDIVSTSGKTLQWLESSSFHGCENVKAKAYPKKLAAFNAFLRSGETDFRDHQDERFGMLFWMVMIFVLVFSILAVVFIVLGKRKLVFFFELDKGQVTFSGDQAARVLPLEEIERIHLFGYRDQAGRIHNRSSLQMKDGEEYVLIDSPSWKKHRQMIEELSELLALSLDVEEPPSQFD